LSTPTHTARALAPNGFREFLTVEEAVKVTTAAARQDLDRVDSQLSIVNVQQPGRLGRPRVARLAVRLSFGVHCGALK
jgi:hypothetical protein